MKPPSKYLKLDQVIDVLLNDSDEVDEDDDEEEEKDDAIEVLNEKIDLKNKNAMSSSIKKIETSKVLENINQKSVNDKEEESEDDDLPIKSKKSVVKKDVENKQSNKTNNKIDDKKSKQITKTIRVPSLNKKSKPKLTKHSSLKKEKRQLELNFLKGIFDFDSLNETLHGDDANLSIVYSDMDESVNFDSSSNDSSVCSGKSDDDGYREKTQNEDKENIPSYYNNKSNSNKSPILMLQNANQFMIASKNPKRKH